MWEGDYKNHEGGSIERRSDAYGVVDTTDVGLALTELSVRSAPDGVTHAAG